MAVRKAFLKQAKERLQEMKAQVMSGIRADLKEGREGNKDDGMDTYDVATEERDREISMLMSDRDRQKLGAIEEALERIEDGSYGICDSCEEEIPVDRLKAMPFTRLCVQCQSERETEAKRMRRTDDSAAFRRNIAPGDFEESDS